MVASILKISISQKNIKCDILVGFPKSGPIYLQCIHYVCTYIAMYRLANIKSLLAPLQLYSVHIYVY